jgi:beta-lactamase class A
LNKRPSYSLTFLLIIVSCAITYFINEYLHCKISEKTNQTISAIESNPSQYKMERLGGYKLIKPLVLAEPIEESLKYSEVKTNLIDYIEKLKSQKRLISASVYLKDLDHGEWMCINDSETYYPGSLIKVPGLITYLKMAEKNPAIFNKKIRFNSPQKTIPNQTYNSKQIESGKEYSVQQLLKYMISYSDNNATYLLNKNVDLKAFHQLFSDLNIPKLTISNSKITARNFSAFFNVLFNASYLNKEYSEYAVELLEECDFKLGLVKGLPVNTVVAHKFGEMGDETTRQLHESGIIYINSTPYLLTIMTKGYDIKELPEIIAEISKLVYEDFIKTSVN